MDIARYINPSCRNYVEKINMIWAENLRMRHLAVTSKEISPTHKKFTTEGKVLPNYGLTVVAPISINSHLFVRMREVKNEILKQLEALDLLGKVFPLPPETMHMTISGLEHQPGVDIPERNRIEIAEKVRQLFSGLSSEKTLSPLRFIVSGLAYYHRSVLIGRVYPFSDGDFIGLLDLHDSLRPAVGKETKPFVGHVSLAYIVQTCSADEFSALVGVLENYSEQVFGELLIEKLELRHFSNMINYGKRPLVELVLSPPSLHNK